MIGLDVYIFYGMRRSFLNKDLFDGKSYRTVALTGLGLVGLLAIVGFLHHNNEGANDTVLYYFSLIFAAIHAIIYCTVHIGSKNKTNKIQ